MPGPGLESFVAWVPKLYGKESDVATATRVIRDPRARQYWDGHAVLVSGYAQALGLDRDAWDIYLLYGPEARWTGDAPPSPRRWMHQLPGLDGEWLDAEALASEARGLLLAAESPSS